MPYPYLTKDSSRHQKRKNAFGKLLEWGFLVAKWTQSPAEWSTGPDQLHYSIHFNITLYYIILYCCFALFQLWGEGGRGRNSVQSKRDFCLNTHRPKCSLAHKLQKQIEFTKHVSPVPVITQSPAVNMHCPPAVTMHRTRGSINTSTDKHISCAWRDRVVLGGFSNGLLHS